jgi:hypothetical protein
MTAPTACSTLANILHNLPDPPQPLPTFPTLEGANYVRPANAVLRMREPRFPHFLFEWHPMKKSLYVIREDGPEVLKKGEMVTQAVVVDEGLARMFMYAWLRGYRTRDQERTRNPALKAEDY